MIMSFSITGPYQSNYYCIYYHQTVLEPEVSHLSIFYSYTPSPPGEGVGACLPVGRDEVNTLQRGQKSE
jgi:hypothetical protein